MARRAEHVFQTAQFLEFVARAAPGRDLVHHPRDDGGPDAAGRAKSAAFMREELREIQRGFEHVAALAEDHEGAGGGNVLEGDAQVEYVRGDAAAGGAPDLHGER